MLDLSRPAIKKKQLCNQGTVEDSGCKNIPLKCTSVYSQTGCEETPPPMFADLLHCPEKSFKVN